jgi:hypothetical protein
VPRQADPAGRQPVAERDSRRAGVVVVDRQPEGQEFFDRIREMYDVEAVDPYAMYGYEAMRLVLTRASGWARTARTGRR